MSFGKISLLIAVLIIGVFTYSVAQQNSFSERSPKQANMVALQPPTTFIVDINASSANWSLPDSLICLELRVKTAGTVRVSTPYQDSVPLYATSYDIFRTYVTKVYKGGTDSLSRTGITALCIKK